LQPIMVIQSILYQSLLITHFFERLTHNINLTYFAIDHHIYLFSDIL
jgi:hypothetical protein